MEQQKEVTKQETATGEVLTERTSNAPTQQEAGEAKKVQGVFQARYIIYYVLGVVEILLVLRLIFKLLGASSAGGFVSVLYSVTDIFIAPFSAIFPTATTDGVAAASVLEPATIIAMVIYALVAWGLSALIGALTAGKE